MKPNARNPFLATILLVAASPTLHADLFDTNGTTSGFGVTNGSTYDWWTANYWSNTASVDDGTAAVVTWQGTSGVSEQAFFVGSGTAGQNYTVRLGATGSTDTYVQNIALNVNAAGNAALSGAAGNVTIGNAGDTGKLIIRASNSVGAQNSGTLTINNGVNLNAQTLNYRGGNVVINGVVSGTGGSKIIVASGAFGLSAGTLTLANTANTYAGRANTDYINANYTLAVTKLANGGSNSSIGTSSANIGINGGTLKYIGSTGAQSTNLGLHVASGGAFVDASGVTSSDTISISGTPTYSAANAPRTITLTGTNLGDNTMGFAFNDNGTGVNALNKSGSGKWILTQANGYTGTTTVSGGYLNIANNGAIGGTSGVSVTGSGASGTVQLADGITVSGKSIAISGFGPNARGALQAAASATAEWAGTVALGSGDSRVGAMSNGTLTISGAIGDGAGTSLIVSADATNGKVIVSGANTYTGSTQIVRGTLALGADNTLPVGTLLNVHSASSVTDGAVFDLNGYSQTVAGITRGNTSGTATITNSSLTAGTLTVNNSSTQNFDSPITGNLSLVKSGAGNQTLSGTSTYDGGTRIDDGTLTLGHATNTLLNTGAVNVNGGILAIGANSDTVGAVTLSSGSITGTSGVLTGASYSISGGIISAKLGGAGAMAKTNTVTLSGDNSAFSGTITQSSGTLSIGHSNALGTGQFINSTNTNTLTNTSGAAINLSNSSYTVSSSLIFGGSASTNNINTGSGTFTLTGSDRILSINTDVSVNIGGEVIGSLRKDGNGTLVLSGTSDNDLTSIRVTQGTVQLSGSTGPATQLTMGHPTGVNVGKFILGSGSGAVNQTFGRLQTTGSAQTSQSIVGGNASVSTLTVNQSTSTIYAGVLGGAGTNEDRLAVTKSGAATLTLTGANSYTGATTVDTGTLALGTGGSISASTTIDIKGSATLDVSALAGWALANGQTLVGNGTVEAGGTGNVVTISNGEVVPRKGARELVVMW